MFFRPCILIIFCNENQPDAQFILNLFRQSTLHVSGMFSVHHQEVKVKGTVVPLQV
jgi:hypothetical protein